MDEASAIGLKSSYLEAARKRLNPPFLGDLTIGLVDGRNLLSCGDRDELLGHATRHQFIGMVFQHQPAVVAPQLITADRGVDSQHIEGLRFVTISWRTLM